MPRPLQNAIDQGDVAAVRRILQERNRHGVPLEDINHVVKGKTATGVLYTLSQCRPDKAAPNPPMESSVAFAIVDLFLSVYDEVGNPVIDLNATTYYKENALEYVLHLYNDRFLTREYTRRLVERLINLRGADGERVLDLAYNGHKSTLIEAVKSNDIHLVRLLLDLRNADGSYAVDVNYCMPWGLRGTALDVAYVGSYLSPHLSAGFRPNHEIIRALVEAGARRNIGLPLIVEEVREPRLVRVPHRRQPPARRELVRDIRDEAARFDANPQNTHSTAVERSVDLSIDSLKTKYYKKPFVSFENTLKQIADYIQEVKKRKLFEEDRINHIERGLSYLCKDTSNIKHIPTSLFTRDIISLVWMGANDKTCLPADCSSSTDPEQFCDLRRQAVLEKFEAIATTYGEEGNFRPSCLGGSRNLIVEALNRAHPLVFIAPTEEAAQGLALEYMKNYLLEKISQLSLPEQRAILNTWGTSDNPAEQFRENTKKDLFDFLRKHLSGVFLNKNNFTGNDWFEDAEVNYSFLPIPIPNRALYQFIVKINQISTDGFSPEKSSILSLLKKKTETIFSLPDQTYEEDIACLTADYNVFILAETLCQQIENLKDVPSDIVNLYAELAEEIYRTTDYSNFIDRVKILESKSLEINSLKYLYEHNQILDTLSENRTEDFEFPFELINSVILLMKNSADKSIYPELKQVFLKNFNVDKLNQLLINPNMKSSELRMINQLFIVWDELTYGPLSTGLDESSKLLQQLEIPLLVKNNLSQLIQSIHHIKHYGEKLVSQGRLEDGNQSIQLATELQKETHRLLSEGSINSKDYGQFANRCRHRLDALDFSNHQSGGLVLDFKKILSKIANFLRFPISIERSLRKDGFSFFNVKTNREQAIDTTKFVLEETLKSFEAQ